MASGKGLMTPKILHKWEIFSLSSSFLEDIWNTAANTKKDSVHKKYIVFESILLKLLRLKAKPCQGNIQA